MAYESREQFRILFLDKRNAMIADEVQGRGADDHTLVYPREVVRRTLEHSATAIILVHNDPSGDHTPSRADIEMTKTIIDTAKTLGINVHDHIIIGKQGHASLKGLRLIWGRRTGRQSKRRLFRSCSLQSLGPAFTPMKKAASG